jgi:sialic acid synthase SpsE
VIIEIDGVRIGENQPTYFIADIAANHDGSLERAFDLIRLAKEAGADAAKFQHFQAKKIVSDHGFRNLSDNSSHQARWKKNVVDVYEAASVPADWTPLLKEECDRVGITFFSSPYDFESVDLLDPFVPAFKIGSGDIDWLEQLEYIARKGKPVILAAGASRLDDVQTAIEVIRPINQQIVLMQCNTNYTADPKNYDFIHLNVLKTFGVLWPDVVLGLSDHTQEPATVLGAVALGARVIERHFTDENERSGPDHKFALNPATWRHMVDQTRLLERALGSTEKFVTENELASVVVQRRCVRVVRDISSGTCLSREDVEVLRPATPGGISPKHLSDVVGKTLLRDLFAGQELRWTDLGEQTI